VIFSLYAIMDNETKACIAIVLAIATKRSVKRKRWVKEWLKKRDEYSHIRLLREIQVTNENEDYRNFLRMHEDTFNKLVVFLTPILSRKDTVMRNSLGIRERLALTLRYLATGRCFRWKVNYVYIYSYTPESLGSTIRVMFHT
jgi:hypothetical protein